MSVTSNKVWNYFIIQFSST